MNLSCEAMADWIFQGNPRHYDLHASVAASREQWWGTPRYRDRMAVSDRVWLQVVGPKDPGIYYVPNTSPAQSSAPTASTPATTRIFTSRHYGYTETPPAGWYPGGQATQQWDGTGAPSDQDNVVDLFQGPDGVEAWATAAPTKKSLAAYARTTTRAAAAEHPCPAVPETDQAITIGGAPARLLGTQCPPGSGFLVETAVTIHDGTGFVFASQNPTGSADKSADRAAFRKFLASIQFQP